MRVSCGFDVLTGLTGLTGLQRFCRVPGVRDLHGSYRAARLQESAKQVILGLTAGSIMPVDRKANDSVGYFGKMPYSGYFGSPFSVGWVGYFGSNLPRQITKSAAAILGLQ